jgi:predicted small lipoprotein YifL
VSRRTPVGLAWGAVFVFALAGCGKKGPPLAPFVRVPAQVEPAETRRVGDDVFISFVVPIENVDKSRPADVRRVEVYAVTTDQPRPPARLLEGASLVTVVSVEPTGPPGSTVPPLPPPGVEPPAAQALPVQGDRVTVQERLTRDELVPQPLAAARPGRSVRGPAAPPVVPLPPRLQRSYVIVAFSDRGRPGPPSAPAIISLDPGPEPPVEPLVSYSAEEATVSWQPSGGLLGYLLDRQLPVELLPTEDDDLARRTNANTPGPLTPGPVRYNIYLDLEPDPLDLPRSPVDRPRWQRRAPRPMNPQPLDALQVTDAVQMQRRRCYTVRGVRGTGADAVEGPPSPTACVRPVDVFPPEAPRGLSTVVGEGSISLFWEASASPDVAGYLVLRGAVGDATLLPVTVRPVVETRYVDRSVQPGTRYVYAVTAVDGAVPLGNASEPSERVEEAAR